MDTLRLLDILGFTVGLVYLYLEYRASIWLWVASIVMPAIDMVLYYKAGLYADFGMAIYYCLAAVYGFAVWQFAGDYGKSGNSGKSGESGAPGNSGTLPITRFPLRLVVPVAVVLACVWAGIWWVLTHYTNSTVPVTDAFTTALSIVALWALARKYAEQWLLWLVVDAVCCMLYVQKGIPFKAAIYGFYTVFAVIGYRKWLRMIPNQH
jgi:nicotinamide mononucleotide transporter